MNKSFIQKSIALLLALAILLAFQPVRPALAAITLQITRTDTGEVQTFLILSNITVADFKTVLEEWFGIPVQCQELWFYTGETKQDLQKYVLQDGLGIPGGVGEDEFSWYLTPTCSDAPKPLYTLWLLTHVDGSRCLLFSESAPSVEAQNSKCFPDEYNNSWVAAHSCGAEVFENGFWECKGDFDAWQGELPFVLRSGVPTPN